MSVPRHMRLDPEVAPARIAAASGELAALVATPPDEVRRLPAVLAVPGYTGSKEDFLHLLPLLARAGHPATAIDLRGQYESGGPEDESAYTIAALADDIISLLGTGEPLHLVGHSFGGLICRHALLAGAPARSLTLLASGPAALGGNRAAMIEWMRPLLAEGGVPRVWEAASAVDGTHDIPVDVQDFLKRRFLASPAAALVGMGEALLHADDRIDELRELGIPTFVLHGAGDDAWLPAEQRKMAERLDARYLELDGALHSPAVETPQATADALLDFWQPLDSG